MASESSRAPTLSREGATNLLLYDPTPPIHDTIPTSETVAPPVTFYDKHIDESLILKNVEKLPSLPECLATLAYRNINNRLTAIQTTADATEVLKPLPDAYSVVKSLRDAPEAYLKGAVQLTGPSTADSREGHWLSSLKWCKPHQTAPLGSFDVEGFSIRIPHGDSAKEATKYLSEETQRYLHEHPELATWEVYAVSSRQLLQDLGLTPMMWETCPIKGSPEEPTTSEFTTPTSDAALPWDIPAPLMNTLTSSKPPSVGSRSRDRKRAHKLVMLPRQLSRAQVSKGRHKSEPPSYHPQGIISSSTYVTSRYNDLALKNTFYRPGEGQSRTIRHSSFFIVTN